MAFLFPFFLSWILFCFVLLTQPSLARRKKTFFLGYQTSSSLLDPQERAPFAYYGYRCLLRAVNDRSGFVPTQGIFEITAPAPQAPKRQRLALENARLLRLTNAKLF